MARFTFTKHKDVHNSYDNTSVVVSSDSLCIPELLEDFADFLRGCGYRFNGSIEVVPEESSEVDDNE